MALSDRDKTLSQAQQNQIKNLTDQWNAAKAKGDQAGMDKAHAAAEAIRNQSGYSGGSDGSQNISIGNSSSSNRNQGTGGTGTKTGSGSTSGTSNKVAGSIISGIGNIGSSIKNNIKNVNSNSGSGTGSTQTQTQTGQISGGVYNITTKEGIDVVNDLKSGKIKSFTAEKDGSVWTLRPDGSIQVQRPDGRIQTGVVGSSGVATTGRVYRVLEGGSAPKGLAVGDQVVTGGGTYVITGVNEDGSYQSQLINKGQTTANYGGAYNQISYGTDMNNNRLSIVSDSNGNIAAILNSDGTPSDARGLITVTENGSNTQYIITEDLSTGALRYIRATNSSVTLVSREEDGSLPEVTLSGANGSTLSGNDLVFGEDGHTYDRRTGQTIGEIAMEYGMDNSSVAVKVGDQYFSLDGTNITNELGAAAIENWTGDQIYDALLNAMKDAGFNQVPQFSDYDQLTWEQALAQAQEQLSSSYQQSLNNTLDELNQKALETGFYGQLPTEALKQQAASASELDKQTAIYDLARNLLGDSQDYAQQQYENDMNTSESRLATIQQMFNYIYQNRQDEVQNAQNQQQLDAMMDEMVNESISLYLDWLALKNDGATDTQASQWIQQQINKNSGN